MAVLSRPTCHSRLRPLPYNAEELDGFTCAVIAKAEGLLGGHRLHDWQARAVWALLKNRDLFVKAGTGSGKSKVFQVMIEAKENGIVLVIVPLKVLMEDQVNKIKELKIPAVALTRENIKEDPGIWERLDRGEFRLVYASPEILLKKGSHFMTHTVKDDNIFREKLTCIAMDEAHTIWKNGEFRGEFNKVGRLRDFFPNIPLLALSATFPPHVVSLVHKVLGMRYPSDIITCNGRRTNINLLVAEQSSRNTIQPLMDLIPRKIINIENDIPKTLIFVDSVLKARQIAIKLRKKLIKKLPSSNPKNIIRTYYSSTDASMKERTISLIKNGTARLTICTDSMSLGVDISDIMRVIQWGVNEKLDLDTLVQRLGRVARDQKLQGVGVIYASKDILEPVPKYTIQEWITQPDEIGRISNETDDDEWEDEDFIIPSYTNRDLSLFSLPVTPKTERQVTDFRRHMYKRAKSNKLRKEAAAERKPRNTRGVIRTRSRKRKSIEMIDPALLWFLNTVGCRHRCILSYLKYPDIFHDTDQKSWCCDRCAISRKLDPETTVTAGISIADSYFFPSDPASATQRKPTMIPAILSRNVNIDQLSPILSQDLKLWRKALWEKLTIRQGIWRGCPDEIVLPDDVIKKIVKDVRMIHNISDIEFAFRKAKFHVKSSLLREKDVEEIFNIIECRSVQHMTSVPTILRRYSSQARPEIAKSINTTSTRLTSTFPHPPARAPVSVSLAPFFPYPLSSAPTSASLAPIFPCPSPSSPFLPATLVHPTEPPVPASPTPAQQQEVIWSNGGILSNTQIKNNKRKATMTTSSSYKRRKPFDNITNRGPPLDDMDDIFPPIKASDNANNVEGFNKCKYQRSSKGSSIKQRRNLYFDIATISNEIRGANKREIKPSRTVKEAKESASI